MRVLPDNLRDALKEPLGKLVDEDELFKLLEKEEYIVSVGDQVTFTLLNHGIIPIFCVVDFKIKRDFCSSDIRNLIKMFGKQHLVVKNPPASISDELWSAIENAYKNRPNPIISIKKIKKEKTWYLGYISSKLVDEYT